MLGRRKVGTQYMNAHSRADHRGPVDLDSTQTMRALSESELYDSHQPRWYAVQLVVSDRPINLDMMPRLDAFAAHQLYALAAKHKTGTWHALRLGFFPDEQSAEVLCEHLRTYFSAATSVRVSVAEQTRFAQRTAAPAPVQKAACGADSAACTYASDGDSLAVSSQERQDARSRAARRSARSATRPQRQEASSGTQQLVDHAAVWPAE
jgi:hypothetical protein